MGLVIRQSISTTIISYLGVLIGYVNLLYLFPRFLQPEQVGLLRTIQDAAILFAPFAQFGLAQSIFRYYPLLAKDTKNEAGFINLILLLACAGFGFFLVLFFLFKQSLLTYFQENAHDIIQYTTIILWLTFILLITALLEAYSRSLLKTVFPNLLREVVVRLLLAVLVLLYFQGWLSFNTFIVGTAMAYMACLLALILYLVAQKKLSFGTDWSLLHKPIFKELLRYSFLSFAGTAGMIIIGKIDSLMVAAMAGLTAVAVYTTAFYMATVIEIPKRALSQIAFPLIARAFEKNDMKDIYNIYQKTSVNQFIIGSLLLIGVYINLDHIFALMPKKEVYEAGRWVVVIVGAGKLIDMLFGPSSEIIVLSRYYWFNIILILLLAVTVVVANNLLIPAYGINGAAAGAALSLVLFNAVKFVFIYFKLHMQPFTIATLKVLAIALLTVALNDWLLVKINGLIPDLLFRSAIVTIFFATLVYVSRASPDGSALVHRLLTRLRKR